MSNDRRSERDRNGGTQSNRPFVVDVVGPAGVGKSTMCRQIAVALSARLHKCHGVGDLVSAGQPWKAVDGRARSVVAVTADDDPWDGSWWRRGVTLVLRAEVFALARVIHRAMGESRLRPVGWLRAWGKSVRAATRRHAALDSAAADGDARAGIVIYEQGLSRALVRVGPPSAIARVPSRFLPDVIVYLRLDQTTQWRRRITRDKLPAPRRVTDPARRAELVRKIAVALHVEHEESAVRELMERWGREQIVPPVTGDELAAALEMPTASGAVRRRRAKRWSKVMDDFRRRGCVVMTYSSSDEVSAEVMAATIADDLVGLLARDDD